MLKQMITKLEKFPPIIRVSLIFIGFGLFSLLTFRIGEFVGRLIYDILH
ncbi:hypothetical protein [Anaerocellum diazotrophicum]|uniref:Uncharacterized protein n=1 Tax=Caldicellulosiruptor diazotrophicus TaxID=2806205 RepID=A0ABM7NQB0_9FIRM|nr:hypothetical protein [Caldicellulosiruptor diazotrophicus]BCS82350.1 hypothetical protein CaldiYA01_23100 [Caldicellulosiruptor diazotrophicus]